MHMPLIYITFAFICRNKMNNSSGSTVMVSAMYRNLESYALAYWHIHPYISLVMCTFGISTNIVNIAILCQKKMRNTINCVLTGIAISDIITMLDYAPYAMHFYLLTDLSKYLYLLNYNKHLPAGEVKPMEQLTRKPYQLAGDTAFGEDC